MQVFLLVMAAHHRVPADVVAITAGLALGLMLIAFRRPNWLLHTFLHECAHALVCVLLLVRVRGMRFSDGRGGEVEHDPVGPVRTMLILLAPYTLPVVLGPLLLARYFLVEPPWRAPLSALVACAWLTHVTGLAHNLRLNLWPTDGDLARTGRLFGLAVSVSALLLLTAATVAVLWSP